MNVDTLSSCLNRSRSVAEKTENKEKQERESVYVEKKERVLKNKLQALTLMFVLVGSSPQERYISKVLS